MKRLGIGLIVLSGLTACGKSEDEEKSKSGITEGAGKLPVSALAKPAGVVSLSRVEVISAMSLNRSDFLATEAEEVAEEDASDETEGEFNCYSEVFSQLTVVAEGETMSVNVNIDLTACMKEVWAQENEGVTADISKALMTIYIEQSCQGVDLSGLNGKKLDEIDEETECDTSRSLINSTSELVGTLSVDGQTLDLNSSTVNVVGTEANEPCLTTRSAGNYAADGCVEIFTNLGQEAEYSKYTGRNLKWAESTSNTWYASGSIDVALNDWTGAVTFQGASVSPLYQMQNATETINGTLTLPTGLYFKNSVQNAILRVAPDLKKRF